MGNSAKALGNITNYSLLTTHLILCEAHHTFHFSPLTFHFDGRLTRKFWRFTPPRIDF